MASAEDYKLKDGTRRWMARWRDPSGRQRKARGFRRKVDARAYGEEREAQKRRGVWVDETEGRLTFAVWAERYLIVKRRKVAPGTFENIEGRVRNHLIPVFGEMPLIAIRSSDVEAWQAELADGLSEATVNSTMGTLRQVFRYAAGTRAITWNPCDVVEGLRVDARRSREIHPLRRAQVIDLAEEVGRYTYRGKPDPRYAAAILLVGLGTGLRPQELWALRRKHIDLDRGTLRVEEVVNEERGGLITGPPKTDKSLRTLSLDAPTVKLLGRQMERYPSSAGLLFMTVEGFQVRHHNFLADVFGPAVERMGDQLPDGFRFYDLRHTHATILRDDGWRVEQVSERLGHSSIRTTVDWYGHLYPNHDKRLLKRLGDRNRKALLAKDSDEGTRMEAGRD